MCRLLLLLAGVTGFWVGVVVGGAVAVVAVVGAWIDLGINDSHGN
jgi:hypothetical protein